MFGKGVEKENTLPGSPALERATLRQLNARSTYPTVLYCLAASGQFTTRQKAAM